MKAHHVFVLLHRGEPLAAAVPATDASRLAWVGVYPLDSSSPSVAEMLRNEGVSPSIATRGPIYRVRRFEIDRALVENDVSIGEPDLVGATSRLVFGDAELRARLGELGVQIERLERPFVSDCPISAMPTVT
jgi:hypothetical protein